MAISLYFGLPGSGKTTLLAKHALDAVKSKKYHHVYTNVHNTIPGVTYIDNAYIGTYDLSNSLVLIDEATLFADSRDHKNFSKERISFFLLSRHNRVDINLYTQQWNGVDLKIRVITDRVYYVYKTPIIGRLFHITKYYRIPYGIIIPDPKKSDGEKLGEIIQGYAKPNFLVRLFCPRVHRRRYYKYFDSFEAPKLDPLPEAFKPNPFPPPTKFAGFLAKIKSKLKIRSRDHRPDERAALQILQDLFQKNSTDDE